MSSEDERREFLAALAMLGFICRPLISETDGYSIRDTAKIAQAAYEQADAMLAYSKRNHNRHDAAFAREQRFASDQKNRQQERQKTQEAAHGEGGHGAAGRKGGHSTA